jgi:hypothetical protein
VGLSKIKKKRSPVGIEPPSSSSVLGEEGSETLPFCGKVEGLENH